MRHSKPCFRFSLVLTLHCVCVFIFQILTMPTNKEKSRRRNISSSSETSCTPASHLHSPSAPQQLNHTPRNEPDELETEVAGLQLEFNSITLPCCNPRGCVLGPISSPSPDDRDIVRMQCSNERCPFSTFMHVECFDSFEEQILSCLRGMSRAKNWSEKQRKQNVWTKKGYDLIYKFCSCRCTKGTLRKDLNHTLPNATPSPATPIVPSSSVTITQLPSEKGKKKQRKKSTSFSEKPPTLIGQVMPRPRTRSHRNSDSVSSDNGTSYMQPFAHRTDYSIFDHLLPHSMVNSYHIKMEDDGYAAGDDTRSLVLSCLAFHHKNVVSCILCNGGMEVYDRFPLLNGTFYLSPVQSKATSLEVETKGDDPLYLNAVCVYCLAGLNRVYCTLCHTPWKGQCHQIGTMYTYDILASNPCCVQAVQCNACKKPLVDIPKLAMSFTQLSSLYECGLCGTKDYHFIRPLSHFALGGRHSDSGAAAIDQKLTA